MSARVWWRPDRAGELAWTTRRLPTRFFTVPSGLLFCGANLAATRLPHPHLRCGFRFVETRSLVGRAVLCPPDLSGCMDGGASRTYGTRPTDSLRVWADWRAAILAAVSAVDWDCFEVFWGRGSGGSVDPVMWQW